MPSGWDFPVPTDTNDGFYLSHIPVPARGKDKKLTAARRSTSACGRTSIRDVIVMLKLCHHVPYRHIQDFPEDFFMF